MASTKSPPGKTVTKKGKKPFVASKASTKRQTRKMDRKKGKKAAGYVRGGPRLPSAMRKELDLTNSDTKYSGSSSDDGGDVDVYDYEETVAEEDARKNRRFDLVESYDYELPKDFKDEEVPSDDEDADGDEEDVHSDQGDGDGDGDKHLKMLESITGIPGNAFEGKRREEVTVTDFQGVGKDGRITIHDLLDPLHGKPAYSSLRKKLLKQDKEPMAIQAPLPKFEREKLERKVAYEHSKKDVTKWEPLVKRNREAPTLYFQEDLDLGYSTVGAIASEFEPRTEFEKKMAMLVRNPEVMEAHNKDGARLLELNKISVEDVRDRQNRLAKMRSLLFRHEMKAKHIKKIKSKTYHRILKKEKLKASATEVEIDPEVAKEYALKQEFKRAEERMTLKHKNRSKWAQRIKKRGLAVQDDGTRAAVAEQLHLHNVLTRKMNSMNDTSSSDESEDDSEDEISPESEDVHASKLLAKAKEKTLKAIEEEDDLPKSGIFALPFMERSLKRRHEEAEEEAINALKEYDTSLKQLEHEDGLASPKLDKVSGRKSFGPPMKKLRESARPVNKENIGSSDSEHDFGDADEADVQYQGNDKFQDVQLSYSKKDIQIASAVNDVPGEDNYSVFKDFDEIDKDSGPKTSYEVSILASDSWKKMKDASALDGNTKNPSALQNAPVSDQAPKDIDQNSNVDSDEDMVDGFLTNSTKCDYELPSQADLIHRAFAGDDVEAEFEKDKLEALDEENPEPEKPVLVPGWGQWTRVQKKRGVPAWMIKEHNEAKRKREEALKKRKDAHLKHVIISEKIDKKADKLLVKALPFPYKSKDVYEQSIRVPIGPDYNPAVAVGALIRPAVVKRPGVIIKPIQYVEVDPHEKPEEPKRVVQKMTTKKPKAKNAKSKGRGGRK